MRTLRLTFRHLWFQRWRSLILLLAISLTITVPIGIHWLIAAFQRSMVARAVSTPFLVGAKGSPFDLMLNDAYFSLRRIDTVPYGEFEGLENDGFAAAIPLHIFFTAKKCPIVGTTPEYYEFRHLMPVTGTVPLQIGDATIGSAVARRLNLHVGDTLLSDPAGIYDIARTFPLNMHIVGVFRESSTADDQAVFVDLKTAWIIEGIGHGHQDIVNKVASEAVLERTASNVTVDDSVPPYTEITDSNIESFHFHGDESQFPLMGIIVLPKDDKSATILRGRYHVSKDRQMIEPLAVVEEFLAVVFRVERFFDLVFVFVAAATMAFISLILLLSIQIRKREFATLRKIGASRATLVWLCIGDVVVLLIGASLIAIAISCVGVAFAEEWLKAVG
ncbi:MAG: hypothetical protein HQM09_21440 [Candidatus Riflebacteria bacterium]|nr:hypothetical protein [Candidatus Riflebacteria bacterium]